MVLRKATIDEVTLLNKLAYDSEAFWGEDDAYMTCFSEEYALTEAMVTNDYVYILQEDDGIKGFFAIIRNEGIWELELFYIERSLIGQGYGHLLWQKMIGKCKELGINRFELVASEDVSDFYRRQGATVVERIPSLLQEGRIVIKYEYFV